MPPCVYSPWPPLPLRHVYLGPPRVVPSLALLLPWLTSILFYFSRPYLCHSFHRYMDAEDPWSSTLGPAGQCDPQPRGQRGGPVLLRLWVGGCARKPFLFPLLPRSGGSFSKAQPRMVRIWGPAQTAPWATPKQLLRGTKPTPQRDLKLTTSLPCCYGHLHLGIVTVS